jgi:hypothetical protein
MGYYSSGYGELTFSRPLNWAEFKDSRLLPGDGHTVLQLAVEETEKDYEIGTMKVRTATGVEWRYDDSTKMYELESEVAEVAKLAKAAGVQVSGHLIRVGEEQPDMERLWIASDYRVETEQAKVIWPSDGSEAKF